MTEGAVYNSQKKSISSGTGKPFERNPYRAAQRWCHILDLLENMKTDFPDDTMIFKYEQIVVEPENVIIQAGKFLELIANRF